MSLLSADFLRLSRGAKGVNTSHPISLLQQQLPFGFSGDDRGSRKCVVALLTWNSSPPLPHRPLHPHFISASPSWVVLVCPLNQPGCFCKVNILRTFFPLVFDQLLHFPGPSYGSFTTSHKSLFVCGKGEMKEKVILISYLKRLQNSTICIWVNQCNSLKAFYENLD